MAKSKQDLLRQIPSVDVLLNDPSLAELTGTTPHQVMVEAVQEAADQVRKKILAGIPLGTDGESISAVILAEAQEYAEGVMKCHFRRVINATGVILHTALGRAALARHAIEQITRELSGYSLLQMDLETGTLCYCGSGHPPALLRRADGRVEELASQHLPIGVAPQAFSGERVNRASIGPGDTIWLYTDGLYELRAPSGKMLGVGGLTDLVAGFDVFDPEPEDDVTLVVAAVK